MKTLRILLFALLAVAAILLSCSGGNYSDTPDTTAKPSYMDTLKPADTSGRN